MNRRHFVITKATKAILLADRVRNFINLPAKLNENPSFRSQIKVRPIYTAARRHFVKIVLHLQNQPYNMQLAEYS